MFARFTRKMLAHYKTRFAMGGSTEVGILRMRQAQYACLAVCEENSQTCMEVWATDDGRRRTDEEGKTRNIIKTLSIKTGDYYGRQAKNGCGI